MRSLRWRLTLSHLLVALGVIVVIAVLSPPLFIQYYHRSEQRRLDAAARGIARVADSLARSGTHRDLEMLVQSSARVIGGAVRLQTPAGTITAGDGTLDAARSLALVLPVRGGQLTVSIPFSGADQPLRVQRQVTLWAAAIAIALALLLAYVSANAMSAPLVEMSHAAEQLAAGNFTVSLRERGPAEVRSLAASMNHMAESLASLDQLRRDFVASASHELRAPLTSIRGFLQALQDGTATGEGERQHCLAAASAEARRMTRLVEDLLQLSRLQAGVLEFEFEPVNLEDLAAGAISSFAARWNDKGVTATLVAEPVPPVMADGERLMQVLVNLLDNALRHSPEGGAITVRVGASVPDAHAVTISVTDQGPGIPEADLPHIFDRFHKADPSRQVGDQGAGLGLAIAREIVARHGGDVFARNREEGGAEVGFWVKARDAQGSPGLGL